MNWKHPGCGCMLAVIGLLALVAAIASPPVYLVSGEGWRTDDVDDLMQVAGVLILIGIVQFVVTAIPMFWQDFLQGVYLWIVESGWASPPKSTSSRPTAVLPSKTEIVPDMPEWMQSDLKIAKGQLERDENRSAVILAASALDRAFRDKLDPTFGLPTSPGSPEPPSTNSLFSLAADTGIITSSDAAKLRGWWALRNRAVHEGEIVSGAQGRELVDDVSRIIPLLYR